jgi:hypothetical protein
MPDSDTEALTPVLVLWHDAAGEDKRCNRYDLPSMTHLLLHSVGWLVADEPTHFTLVMDWWDDGQQERVWRNWLAIPRACVVSIEPLHRSLPEIQT